jgi:hypothetical protein
MRNAEVSFTRLTSADKRLFDFAKQKEVKQFLKEEAVRRCKDEAENQEGWRSGRIMKACWALTWKAVPAEEQAESRAEAQANRGATNLSMDGKRKAKARIVIVGFQHPDLGSSRYKTAAPEMSTMGRMLVYQLIVPNGWDIEGLDMLTAFLQTKSHQEEEQLWTTGAPELRQALGCSDEDLLQIVKNLYGLTTAPRALWEDINRACVSHEGHPVVGDQCIWTWYERNSEPKNEHDRFKLIGVCGSNVDDFIRSGDNGNPRWAKISDDLGKAYKWGAKRTGQFRFVGTDIRQFQNKEIELDQSFYIETLEDMRIDPTRSSNSKLELTDQEMSQTRGALEAILWVAVQTQIQVAARTGILMSELSDQKSMKVAQEVQELIREL